MYTISVIIPVYNGERYLAEAIQSVLDQTWPVTEIMVVDDGSTDCSAQIAAAFSQVLLVQKTHSGLSPTLNEGVRNATGELLAFLDADDRWLPEKLSLQIPALAQYPPADIVFGQGRRFKMVEDEISSREELLDVVSGVSKSSMLVPRAVFMQVGEFAEATGAHDFLDWYARATSLGLHVVMVPQVIWERRIHADNDGVRNPSAQRLSYLRTLREKLRRERDALPSTDSSDRDNA